MYKELIDVSYKSVWMDTRKDNFQTQIQKDSSTMLEIDFMLNPIYSINIETGIIETLKKVYK